MTEHLLARSVREAAIYTRLWEINHVWVALTIADACEDIYVEFASQPRDLAEVLDMEVDEVGENVRGFIGYRDNGGGGRWYNSKDDTDDDDSKNECRLEELERRIGTLDIRLDSHELYPPPWHLNPSGPRAPKENQPTLVRNDPWAKPITRPLQEVLVNETGTPRIPPTGPQAPTREEPARKSQAKVEVWPSSRLRLLC